jgi:hypothetical protein
VAPAGIPHPPAQRRVPSTASLPYFDEATRLLRDLSGPHGIHASLADTANYRAVFARDGVMAGIAGLMLGDETVTRGLVRTLEGLREHQGPEGQVASNFEVRDGLPTKVSYGTLVPRIDAVTWYLRGVAIAARAGAIDLADFDDSVRAAVRLLDAIEYNGRHLVYVPAGGNWADEYVYEGYILYDQVLRGWALRALGRLYGERAWERKADAIGDRIAETFWTGERGDEAGREYPIAAWSPTRRFEMFDLAACSLLAVSGLVPGHAELAERALRHVARRWLDHGALPPAFDPVIDESHPEWPALARYQLHGFRNRPHEYHNGGVWPIWLGWLALAQAATGRHDDLARLRALIAERLAALPGYAFEEYLHGQTGRPGGVPRMGYTATGLVFLQLADERAAGIALA